MLGANFQSGNAVRAAAVASAVPRDLGAGVARGLAVAAISSAITAIFWPALVTMACGSADHARAASRSRAVGQEPGWRSYERPGSTPICSSGVPQDGYGADAGMTAVTPSLRSRLITSAMSWTVSTP